MVVLLFDIEVLGLALSMVGLDEVLDLLRQVILVGQLDAFGDMADEHLGTVNIGEAVVRIDANLVLREIGGIHDLTDVVV